MGKKKAQSQSQDLLQTLTDFTSKDNWDKFFTLRGSDDSFEWYAEWPQLRDPLPSALAPAPSSAPAPPQILVPGYGNSRLSKQLYDAGFHSVTNIDFSKVVISDMLRRNVRDRPAMKWRVMDMTSMQETPSCSSSFFSVLHTMAGPTPSYNQETPSHAISVVGPQYCLPYPFDLEIVKKVLIFSDGNFIVTDAAGNILFQVKGVLLTFVHPKRVLLDAAGNPIMTLRKKCMTAHCRWQVFRGESTEPQDLMFSAKTSSILYFKAKLHVFLAGNANEDVCDFRVEGSWFDRSYTIYASETPTVIAQMHRKCTVQSVLIGKDNYMVTVCPNVDYAFVVALIVVLDGINHTGRQS